MLYISDFLSILTYYLLRTRVASFYDNHFIHLILLAYQVALPWKHIALNVSQKERWETRKRSQWKTESQPHKGFVLCAGQRCSR